MPVTSSPTITGPGVQANRDYVEMLPIWQKLANVHEGSGGFRDGTYLFAHPREYADALIEREVDIVKDGQTYRVRRVSPNPNPSQPSPKLVTRRKLASYENIAAPIVDTKASALFRTPPTRRVGDGSNEKDPLLLWMEDVDGRGTSMDDFMKRGWVLAAVFGHVFIVMDRDPLPPDTPATQATVGKPFLTFYLPQDAPDWRTDRRGALVEIKLLEAIERESLEDTQTETASEYIVRTIDDTQHKIARESSRRRGRGIQTQREEMATVEHGMGKLPVIALYAKRSLLHDVLGISVLNDPGNFIDLYNINSEVRELLRNQTFGIFSVQLPADGSVDIEKAQSALGPAAGTSDVAFGYGPMVYVQPDTNNVTVYQEERKQKIRTIYRLACVPFEIDSRDSESEGALKLKREDMKQVLSDYANELERTERALADLWYRATYGGDVGPQKMKAAGVTITYDRSFDVQPFAELLEQAQAVTALDYPWEVNQALQKRLLPQVLPDAPPVEVEKLMKAIEAKEDPAELQRKEREKMLKEGFGPKKPGLPPQEAA